MYFQGGKDHPLFFAEKRKIGSKKEGKKKKKKKAGYIGTNKQQTLKNHQIVTYQYNKKKYYKIFNVYKQAFLRLRVPRIYTHIKHIT